MLSALTLITFLATALILLALVYAFSPGGSDIAARLARHHAYQAPRGALVIHNDGSLNDAGDTLLKAITQPR